MSGPWMSIIEYARQYNVSDMTVRRRIKTGRLNAELREGKYYIPVQASGDRNRKNIQNTEHKPVSNFEVYESKTSKPETMLRALRPEQYSEQQSKIQFERLTETFELALDQIKQREELLKDNFESERLRFSEKLKFMEHEIKNKDREISSLKKEIEDLEILVRILESKTP